METLLRVALGRVPGGTRVAALGFNPDVDTTTFPEDIWPTGGLYPWATAAFNASLVSSSAADSAAGTGARNVLISGLDSSYLSQTELIATNGVTPVVSTKAFMRINSLLIMDAGTGETNAGVITVTRASDAAIQSTIPAGEGISQQAIYTVAAGYTLVLVQLEASLNLGSGIRSADIALVFRQLNASTGNRFVRTPRRLTCNESGPTNLIARTGVVVSEKTDFALRCTYTSASNLALTGAWEGILFENAMLTR